ncbi:site-specific integrase [Ruminococcus sp. 5_1_39BFAA]|uniref:site-specific integrase n=1 Tax=Ruminococcus sp. 5_1_39BFAA TaxID=457412 RepID=UPI0035695313
MAKRGENIRKRSDGRWEARYEKGRLENGRIHYGYVYARTYDEVKKKKILALQQAQLPEPISPGMTMDSLCTEWKMAVRYTIKESSFACYDTLIEKHIIPWFSECKLAQINTNVIMRFTISKTESGLSNRTVKSLLILLQSILKYGENKGYLSLRSIQFTYPKVTSQGFRVISEAHVHKLIDTLSCDSSPFSSGILLCIYTGIRVGELSGLKWGDFDFEKQIMSIRRTISRVKNLEYMEGKEVSKTRLLISTPKSQSSIRSIPIPEVLLERLESQKSHPADFLLTGTTKCMEPRCIQRRFQTLLEQCDIPKINIHALRHAFATRCTEIGFDSKALSEILGHSSAKITMDIYVHSNLQQKKSYMDKLYY